MTTAPPEAPPDVGTDDLILEDIEFAENEACILDDDDQPAVGAIYIKGQCGRHPVCQGHWMWAKALALQIAACITAHPAHGHTLICQVHKTEKEHYADPFTFVRKGD